jgi:hypothetical protein
MARRSLTLSLTSAALSRSSVRSESSLANIPSRCAHSCALVLHVVIADAALRSARRQRENQCPTVVVEQSRALRIRFLELLGYPNLRLANRA